MLVDIFILGVRAPKDVNKKLLHVGIGVSERKEVNNTLINKYFNAVSRAPHKSYPSQAFRYPYQSRLLLNLQR